MKLPKLEFKSPIKPTPFTIGNFWQWAYSDILSNANRGVFAEYLVASALDAAQHARIEWDAFDIEYHGLKIEVKSAAYLQSWQQKKHSTIRFDIAKKLSWQASTNEYSPHPHRPADIYVFCILAERDRTKLNVLDTSQWRFHVLPTQILNDELPEAKSISLNRLSKLADQIAYGDLKAEIDVHKKNTRSQLPQSRDRQ